MNVLVVDSYYPRFLDAVYAANPVLAALPYAAQHAFLMRQLFGTADFYSRHLRRLGHDAQEVIANNAVLQEAWAREHGPREGSGGWWSRISRRLRRPLRHGGGIVGTSLRVLAHQIRHARPDVLYCQDLSLCPASFLNEVRQDVRLIAGQIACPLPPDRDLRAYDLLVTSLPNLYERFRAMGIRSELARLAFEPAVLAAVGPQPRRFNCTFVGGISPHHSRGTAVLEEAAREVAIDFFGYGADTLPSDSAIRRRHHGEVWGQDMYRVLLQSKVTINRHIGISGDFANNMRLYEATGCGALLITDAKSNLSHLFKIGTEVVTYSSAAELCELVRYYGAHDDERERIAAAGQTRTLEEHTYGQRVDELARILEHCLRS